MADLDSIKKRLFVDKLITHCSTCKHGVFADTKWVWTVDGIVHKECVK